MKWPYQSTPYLSALPGVGGPGLDVSKGDLPSKIYFVTSTANEKTGGPDPRGPNCFSGTFWWCWYADQGEGFHKFIVPLVGGYCYLGRGMNAPERDNLDYIGHAAPGAGLFVQTAKLNVRGSNSRVWHLASWMGDLPSVDGPESFQADQRDCLAASSDTNDIGLVAFINCEARFGMDEAAQVWYDTLGVSWIRGAIYDPLHTPPNFAMGEGSHHEPGVDHGYGYLLSGRANYALCLQSLFAHTTDRNPTVAAPNYAHINNLHYNHGRPDVGRGAGVKIDDNGEYNETDGRTMQFNAAGSITVRGPNQGDGVVFAEVQDITPGSSAHLAHNSQYGWDQLTSQDELVWMRTPDPSYLRTTLRVGAWPLGLGFDYDGVLLPCADPLQPTIQEGLRFAQLIRETVGCMPARRYLYTGGVNHTMDQIDAAIRGIEAPNQFVNTVDEAGGWPTMAACSVDPATPNQWHHEPMPLGADRDDLVTSGKFSDGSSKVGYTKLRAWCIEQYFSVMGR